MLSKKACSERHVKSHVLAIACLLVLSACGQPVPDMDIDGVGVKDDTGVLLADPTFPARFQAEAKAALRYAGGSWEDLRGYVVVFANADEVDCADGTDGVAIGCTDGWRKVVTLAAKGYQQPRCFADMPLVHELLHVVIGDRCHNDWRFSDFKAAAREIAELELGYDACKVVDPVFWTTMAPSC